METGIQIKVGSDRIQDINLLLMDYKAKGQEFSEEISLESNGRRPTLRHTKSSPGELAKQNINKDQVPV